MTSSTGGSDASVDSEAPAENAPRPVAVLFGDRTGLAVFLLGVVFLGLCWRVGFFITDSRTLANVLANVAEGRLAVLDTPYSLTATAQPGLVESGGRLYGRNYGQVYLAVPLVWLLDGLTALVDLRLLVAGLWSAAVVLLGHTAARVLERPRLETAGTVLGVASIALAVLFRTPLASLSEPIPITENPVPIVALQVVTVLVTATAATVLYRLLARVDDRRVGAAAGIALVVATPVGFWGTLPKRHVFTAAFLLLACLLFAYSRTESGRRATLARAGAYGAIGYLAAIHAFEAVFMLVVLAAVDLLSAWDATPRQHAVVVAVFLVGLAPMLATNAAIAGDPFSPPRTLSGASDGGLPPDLGEAAEPPADGDGTSPQDGGGDSTPSGDSGDASTDGGNTDGAGDGDGGGGLPIDAVLAPILVVVSTVATIGASVVETVTWIGGKVVETAVAGLASLLEPERLYQTFVRSGWIPGVNYRVNTWETVELTMLEAFPLAGGLVGVPALAVAWGRDRWRDRVPDRFVAATEWRAVDALAVGMGVVFVLSYLPLLPLHSMVTLRYVVPAMPLLLYGLCRLTPVRAAVGTAGGRLARSYLVTLALGGGILLVGVALLDPAVGEAFQLHALVGLAAAGVAAGTVATWPVHRRPRVVATALALAAGVTTLFLLTVALWHVPYGVYALDVARVLGEALPPVG